MRSMLVNVVDKKEEHVSKTDMKRVLPGCTDVTIARGSVELRTLAAKRSR